MADRPRAITQTKNLSGAIQTKTSLRDEGRQKLKAISSADRVAGSAQLCARLEQQSIWRSAKAILGYAPYAEEPDIWPLLESAIADGNEVFLPSFSPDDGHYEARWIRNLDSDLAIGKFGIREPLASCPKILLNRLDLILVPGIAFDAGGHRIGRGKGFYDRLLLRLQGPACGVAFDQQIIPAVPQEPHDIRLSYIVTPTRWLEDLSSRQALK